MDSQKKKKKLANVMVVFMVSAALKTKDSRTLLP